MDLPGLDVELGRARDVATLEFTFDLAITSKLARYGFGSIQDDDPSGRAGDAVGLAGGLFRDALAIGAEPPRLPPAGG